MKLLVSLFFLLNSLQVFACKMTPESYKKRAESVAQDFIMKNHGQDQKIHKTKLLNGLWNVYVTKDGKCSNYIVKVTMPGANCKMNAELLSQKECSI